MSLGISRRIRRALNADSSRPTAHRLGPPSPALFQSSEGGSDGVAGEQPASRASPAVSHSAIRRSVGTPALSASVRGPYMFST